MLRILMAMLLIATVIPLAGQSRLNEAIQFFNEGKTAYQQGNLKTYLRKTQQAHALLPYSKVVKYNLAAAYAVNDRLERSFQAISELIELDNRMEFNADSVFYNLKSDEQYFLLQHVAANMDEPIGQSAPAFEVEELDLHPESVAFSPGRNLFYLSSLRKRKVITYNRETAQSSDWITRSDQYDLYGVMGMKVSADDQYLWFCSSPMPQMEDYAEDGRYTPTIFKVSLDDPNQMERYALPAETVPGDLFLSPSGDCYVTDSATPRVFVIRDGHASLFFDGSESLVNLQGLTMVGEDLFIADYLLGLFRLSTSDKTLIPIQIDSPHNTAGVDGLYTYQKSLIAIHNGVFPYRIAQYEIDGDRVTDFEYFERGSPYLDEPTLGVVVGDQFFFVSNSPWGYYDGNALQIDYLKKPQVRKITFK